MGYKAKLKPGLQGINKAVLILELEITKPSGFVPRVVTPLPVRYEEEIRQGQYTNVHVRADGELLTEDEIMDVEIVQ